MQRALERHRNILDFALSSLLRRSLKNLSLLTLYTLIVAFIASLVFFVQSLKSEASLLLQDAPDIVVQQLMAGRHDLIQVSSLERIAAIRGVTAVAPRYWGYYYDPVFGANYTIMSGGDEPLQPQEAIIGQSVARNQRLQEGDLFNFRRADGTPLLLTVKKILPRESELLAADLVLVTNEDFISLFGFPRGVATDLAITVANPDEIRTVAGKIAELLPASRPILKSEILRTYDSIFDWRGGMMVVILAMAVLAFVIFAWDKASGLSAEERREMGILKSIGWETTDILLLKFWEGIAISLTAFLLGIIIAYCHVYFFSAGIFAGALKGWSVLYPEFRLHPTINPYQIAVIFFLTVFPYTAATIVPSWLAATIDPDTAMRS
jgi:ABC-type lipoprotein release transport system permease subunit